MNDGKEENETIFGLSPEEREELYEIALSDEWLGCPAKTKVYKNKGG